VEGMLDLHGVTNVKGEVCGKTKSVITLTTKLREWSFGASNDAEMNEWVTLIKNILASLDSEHALVRVPKGTDDGQGTIVNSLDELPEEAKVIVSLLFLVFFFFLWLAFSLWVSLGARDGLFARADFGSQRVSALVEHFGLSDWPADDLYDLSQHLCFGR
jgi:hypothetical protein